MTFFDLNHYKLTFIHATFTVFTCSSNGRIMGHMLVCIGDFYREKRQRFVRTLPNERNFRERRSALRRALLFWMGAPECLYCAGSKHSIVQTQILYVYCIVLCEQVGVLLMAVRNVRRQRRAQQRALSSYVQRSAYRNLLESGAAGDASDDEAAETEAAAHSHSERDVDVPTDSGAGTGTGSVSLGDSSATAGAGAAQDVTSGAAPAAPASLPVAGSSDA